MNEDVTRDIARMGRVPTMIGAMLHAPAIITGEYVRRGDSLIVMQEGAGVRQVIDDALRTAGLRDRHLEVKLELGLQESVKSAVAAGYGVSFISRSAIEAELSTGAIAAARVEGLEPAREISLATATGRTMPRTAAAFLDFARERLP